jgi:hypothetical protein
VRAREPRGRLAGPGGPVSTTTPAGRGAPLLRLQRTAGNAAVTKLLDGASRALARAPRKGAAPAAKPKAYSLSISESHWDRAALLGHARDAFNAADYGHAAALLERAYELSPGRDIALEIYRCYQKLGDKKQAEHWLSLHHGAATGDEPPVAYQQF